MADMTRSVMRPLIALVLMLGLFGAEAADARPADVTIVVSAEPGKRADARRAVERAGGEIAGRLDVIHGFSARVPRAAIARLRRADAIRSLVRDVPLHLSDESAVAEPESAFAADRPAPGRDPDGRARGRRRPRRPGGRDPRHDGGVARPRPRRRRRGHRARCRGRGRRPRSHGAGRAPARGRRRPRPRLHRRHPRGDRRHRVRAHRRRRGRRDHRLRRASASARSAARASSSAAPTSPRTPSTPDLRGLDTFGHGSHMAGVIAGDDPATGYRGVAPGARLVSVKVAGADGITSLVRVLMALDWVRRNRNEGGLKIRVLNLSLGVDAQRSYVAEPLAYAAESLWHRGVAVDRRGRQPGRRHRPARPARLRPVAHRGRRVGHRREPRGRLLLARREPPARRRRARHVGDLHARPGLHARRGVPGRAHRRRLLPRQRHLAGDRRRLRPRRAAARRRARSSRRTSSRRCCAAARSTCPTTSPPTARAARTSRTRSRSRRRATPRRRAAVARGGARPADPLAAT